MLVVWPPGLCPMPLLPGMARLGAWIGLIPGPHLVLQHLQPALAAGSHVPAVLSLTPHQLGRENPFVYLPAYPSSQPLVNLADSLSGVLWAWVTKQQSSAPLTTSVLR